MSLQPALRPPQALGREGGGFRLNDDQCPVDDRQTVRFISGSLPAPLCAGKDPGLREGPPYLPLDLFLEIGGASP
ncbi:hypothetical protein D3C86_1902550 [compost metagenome]